MAELTNLQGDLFWDWEDSEQSQNDPDDFFSDGYMEPGQVFRFQRALRLTDVYGFAVRNEDGEDETHYFDTQQEAETALREYKEKAKQHSTLLEREP